MILGNPQNMIVAQDATEVMPPLKFLGIMLLPSVVTWLMSEFLLKHLIIFQLILLRQQPLKSPLAFIYYSDILDPTVLAIIKS